MTRIVTVGAAQLGPIARTDTRARVVARMHGAAARGARRTAATSSSFPSSR